MLNSILSHCLLLVCSDSVDGESVATEYHYLVSKQSLSQNYEMVESLLSIVDISEKFIKKMKIESEKQYQLLDINVIKSVLYNGICKVVQLILT